MLIAVAELEEEHLVDMRKLMSVTKVSDEKEISRKRVYELIERDDLTGYEIDGMILVLRNQQYSNYKKGRAGRKRGS